MISSSGPRVLDPALFAMFPAELPKPKDMVNPNLVFYTVD